MAARDPSSRSAICGSFSGPPAKAIRSCPCVEQVRDGQLAAEPVVHRDAAPRARDVGRMVDEHDRGALLRRASAQPRVRVVERR